MKVLKPNLYIFESVKASHVYLIRLLGRDVIIDTSLPGKGKRILAELSELDIKPKMVSDILITHHDIDHIGSAEFLQQATGAKVWMHELDAAYAMGTKRRPPVKRFLGFFMRTTLPKLDGLINADAEIIPGIRAIHTAGHTPGHTVYQWQNVIFSGDAVIIKKNGQLKLLPSIMNADHKAAQQSLKLIEKLPYKLICPAHGEPYSLKEQQPH